MNIPAPLSQIRIVLVNTTHAGNIGASARAMMNMGLAQLVLVKPKSYPHVQAEHRAKGGLPILENAQIVDSLEEAVADCALVVGTSARSRKVSWPSKDARDSAEEIIGAIGSGRAPVAVLFGREDRGLLNSELQLCQWQLHIPSNAEYSSLNISMAVQLVAYELHLAALAQSDAPPDDQLEWPTAAELEYMHEHLQEVLQLIHFYDPDNPGHVPKRMRKLFTQTQPDSHELGMLRGFLTAIQNTLDGNPRQWGKHKN